MPEQLRVLLFIVTIAAAGFAAAKRPLTAAAMTSADYGRRATLWFAMTACAFLAGDFWIFVFAFSALLLWGQAAEWNPLGLFLLLTIAIPRIAAPLPGMGVANSVFDVDHVRVLALLLLLPAWVRIARKPGTPRIGSLLPDKILIAYLALDVLLTIQHRSLTSVIRESCLYAVTDVLLPYLVASRTLTSLRAFRDCIATFVIGASILSLVLMFEMLRGWVLYMSLDEALGVSVSNLGDYLGRGGNLRGKGSIGNAILAGYVVAIAFGLYAYLERHIPSRGRLIGIAVMVGGMVGALSRGPWLQAAMSIVLFRLLGPAPMRNVMRLGVGLLVALLFLTATGRLSLILDYLPWVGTIDSSSLEGREMLWETSWRVMMDNPIFGRFDFMEDPRIQALRGGDGLIDITNSYAQIGLRLGMLGLGTFLAFFVTIGVSVSVATFGRRRASAEMRRASAEMNSLGRALLTTLAGVLFLIATCSSILVAPILYWSLAGMCVAFVRLARQRPAPLVARSKSARRMPSAAELARARTPRPLAEPEPELSS